MVSLLVLDHLLRQSINSYKGTESLGVFEVKDSMVQVFLTNN